MSAASKLSFPICKYQSPSSIAYKAMNIGSSSISQATSEIVEKSSDLNRIL